MIQQRDRGYSVAASSYTVERRTLLACVEKNCLLDGLENSQYERNGCPNDIAVFDIVPEQEIGSSKMCWQVVESRDHCFTHLACLAICLRLCQHDDTAGRIVFEHTSRRIFATLTMGEAMSTCGTPLATCCKGPTLLSRILRAFRLNLLTCSEPKS
jgi:hypothetical protein